MSGAGRAAPRSRIASSVAVGARPSASPATVPRVVRDREPPVDVAADRAPAVAPSAPLSLRLAAHLLSLLFGLLSLVSGRRRATHATGVAGFGTARIVERPTFPPHSFFTPGRVFPVVLRHANLTFADDRMRDVRGATLRLGGLADRGEFDMAMNTGEASVFWDLRSFVDFLVATVRGETALRALSARSPLADAAARDGLVRGPSSYAALRYHSQLAYRFVDAAGRPGLVRYRLIPEDEVAAAPALDLPPWRRDPDPDDERPAAYLAAEYRERLTRGPVRYRFQLQHRPDDGGTEALHAGKAWDLPWHEVAEVEIDSPLDDTQCERLQFNVGHQPESLGILPPRALGDLRALAWIRQRVYARVQRLRLGRRRRQPDWDYRPGTPLPRAAYTDGKLPETYGAGRGRASYAPPLLRLFVLYLVQSALARLGLISSKAIQRQHRDNLTLRMERERPGSSRSDEWLADRLLNGFSPLPLRQDDHDPQRYIIDFRWDDLVFDGPLDLPNARATLRLDGSALRFEEIRVQHRAPGQSGPDPILLPARTARPGDGVRWELAKLLLRSNWVVEGQALAHFVSCHINVEQYAVAARRQLHRSPVATLLFPHLKEVIAINESGDGTIFGETGVITTNSALHVSATNRLFVTHLGRLSWAWRPRAPVCEADRFARIATLYWDLAERHCARFVEENRAAIAEHWLEVFAFSRDLVVHAVPFTEARSVPGTFVPSPPGLHVPTHPRPVIGSVHKAIHPVTLARRDPTAEDLANLVQVCTYAIFHATLLHTLTNDVMHDDLGECAYASGGLDGDTVRRLWDEGAAMAALPPLLPPPYQTAYQLFFANYLSGVRYGFLLRNEDGDMPRDLIDAVVARRADFAALGFDVDGLRARINI